MVKMQEKREGPRRFWQAVAPPQSITPLKLVDRDDSGGGPPSHYEGRDHTKIRILLADSVTIYRVGIQKIFALEDDIRVIARVDTLAGLHEAIQRFPTDLVLLEGRLILGAVDTISELIRMVPKLKIVVELSQNDQINTAELYCRGVRGIIPRSISPDLVVKCVRKIAAGETWIDNQSVNLVIEAFRSQDSGLTNPRTQPHLSPKELAIITCITQGMPNKEIASQLGTSEQVIKNYLRKIYGKLGVSDRLDLALSFLHDEHRVSIDLHQCLHGGS
jgi:DNA-binding NarL/FixJ family response regulator